MHIAIGADHGGIETKNALVSHLEALGHQVTDYGCTSTDSVDYPDFAAPVAQAVAAAEADRGVLVCGTGIGMAIAANKIKGIRAANITRPDFAALTRQHNNTNVITLSGRFITLEENKEILKVFLETEFEGGRHQARINKIHALEG